MKTPLFILGMLLSISTVAQQPNYSENSILLKFKEATNLKGITTNQKFERPELQQLRNQFTINHVDLTGNRLLENTYAIHFEENQNIEEVVKLYSETGLFQFVEPNYTGASAGECEEILETIPSDPLFSRQWGLKNTGTFPLAPAVAGADIKMTDAWDIETGSSNLIIAVLDSGVKTDHPELAGRLWINNAEILDGIDNDGNGFIDDIQGWNFAYGTNNVSDDWGHGTNIIGLLASAPNNTAGYAGVNWASTIMPVKMLNSQGVYTTAQWAIDALYYAVNMGADVVNMSFGGSGDSVAFHEAVQFAHTNGVVMTVSMMNFNNNTPYYPAAWSETIAVGSIDPDGERSNPFFWNPASGSNFGPHIDLIAPGNFTYGLSGTSNTNYNIYWGGTSQAAPLVAGIASLLLSQDASLTPEQIRTIVNTTATDQTGDPIEDTPGFDDYYGFGRLNAFEAMNSILNVSENSIENSIVIYPNPATTDQSLKIKSSNNAISEVRLYSVLGTLLFSKSYSNGMTSVSLDVSGYAAGVYMLQIIDTNNKLLKTDKLIIKD